MRKLLIIVGVMIGLSSASVPAWAACEFTLSGTIVAPSAATVVGCGAEITNLANKALDQWKAQQTSLKFGKTGTTIGITVVGYCDTKNPFTTSAKGTVQSIYLCLTYNSKDGSLPPLWMNYCGTENAGNSGLQASKDMTQKVLYNAYGQIFGSCTSSGGGNVGGGTGQPKPPGNDGKQDCPSFKMLSNGVYGDPFTAGECDFDGDGLGNFQEKNHANPAYPGCKISPVKFDTDGDGLLDGQELSLKTNPCSGDTDGDGLTDYEEATKHYTNPLKQDTDGDGVIDSDEVCLKLNPLDKVLNSDTDTLSNKSEIDWNKAKVDGFSAWLNSKCLAGFPFTDKNYLDFKLADTDGDGLNDDVEVNESKTYPNKQDSDDDTLTDDAEWNNKEYHDKHSETGFFLDPIKADSDGDDLTDDLEIKNKTDPRVPDTDKDGLTDYYEVTYHDALQSKPTDDDTDGDNLKDGKEYSINLIIQGYKECVENMTKTKISMKDCLTKKDASAEQTQASVEPTVGVDSTDLYAQIYFLNDDDRDKDELKDDGELEYGTYPGDPDTDHDGINDYDEVKGSKFEKKMPYCKTLAEDDLWGAPGEDPKKILRTDPLNPDSDDDGLKDEDEVKLRKESETYYDTHFTDPTLPGYSWDATVPGADSYEEDPTDSGDYLYEGGGAPTGCMWTTSTLEEEGEIVKAGGGGQVDPMTKDSDGDGLNDGAEIKLNGLPYASDTDGDGLPDGREAKEGTKLDNTDSDEDGLTDYEEVMGYRKFSGQYLKVAKTDPLNVDSDGDGICDGAEVVDGCKPGPDNCPKVSNGPLTPGILYEDIQKDTDKDKIGDACDEKVDSSECGKCAELVACTQVMDLMAKYQAGCKQPGTEIVALQTACQQGYLTCVSQCGTEAGNIILTEEPPPSIEKMLSKLGDRQQLFFIESQKTLIKNYKALSLVLSKETTIPFSLDDTEEAIDATIKSMNKRLKCEDAVTGKKVYKWSEWTILFLLTKSNPAGMAYSVVEMAGGWIVKDGLKIAVGTAEKAAIAEFEVLAEQAVTKGILKTIKHYGKDLALNNVYGQQDFMGDICVDDQQLMDLPTDKEALIWGIRMGTVKFVGDLISNYNMNYASQKEAMIVWGQPIGPPIANRIDIQARMMALIAPAQDVYLQNKNLSQQECNTKEDAP